MIGMSWPIVFAAAVAFAGPADPATRVVNDRGVWWFQSPDGAKHLAKGVNVVGPGTSASLYDPSKPEYSTFVHLEDAYEIWERRTQDRLKAWGFNTIGGWSDPRTYRWKDFFAHPFTNYQVEFGSIWFDLWNPDYESKAMETAKRLVAPYLDNQRVSGYWLDNEFGWAEDYFFGLYFTYPDWMGDRTKAPGKRRLIAKMKTLYKNDYREFLKDFTTDAKGWDGLFTSTTTGLKPGKGRRAVDAWMEDIGRRYYGVAKASMKAADPRTPLLGDRFRQYYPQGLVRGAKGFMDVISTNWESPTTDGWISPVYFETLHELSGCPVIVGEIYANARQNRSGNRHHGNYFTLTDTQGQRAKAAANQVRHYAAFPFVVGWHWFQYYDEPTYGRNDGENYNMGLVDIFDEPYAELTEAIARAHSETDAIHAQSATPKPKLVLPLVVRRQAGLTADGQIGDWDKSNPVPRALLKAANGQAPFADVFLAWDDDSLRVMVRAYEFSSPQPADSVNADDPATWAPFNRLSVDVGDAAIRAAAGKLESASQPEGNPVVYALPPKRGQLSAAIDAYVNPWHYVWEVAIPASSIGKTSFKAGTKLTIKIRIENRGEWESQTAGLDVVLAD